MHHQNSRCTISRQCSKKIKEAQPINLLAQGTWLCQCSEDFVHQQTWGLKQNSTQALRDDSMTTGRNVSSYWAFLLILLLAYPGLVMGQDSYLLSIGKLDAFTKVKNYSFIPDVGSTVNIQPWRLRWSTVLKMNGTLWISWQSEDK